MINYNIVLYIGLFLIVGGFSLFLYAEMRARELDRQLAMNKRLDMAFKISKRNEEAQYSVAEISGAWYECYGEYLKDDYKGFIKQLTKFERVKNND